MPYRSIVLLMIIMLLCINSYAQSCNSLSNTFRMNQNIHNVPLDEKEQDDLIERYSSMGYGGFTVNVNYNEYLTEKGMNAFKSFCDKAKANNLELWLYDEQGYPSGSAGGRVFLQNEAWEVKGIFKKDTIVQEGLLQYKILTGKLVKAYAINGSDTFDIRQFVDQNILNWEVPIGTWKIVVFSKNVLYDHFQVSLSPNAPREKLSAHYPSLMIPEVTQAFIKSTYEKYIDYFGEDLGEYFTSTFTDEPSLMAVSFFDESWSVIPWAAVLSETVFQKYGYRPENKLLELFEDKGSNGQKIRYQYFHTVGELISQNYFRTLKNWCAQHHLKSGGHLLLEETMMAHVPLYGDIFACFRQMDAPGIDVLSCIPENTPVHAPKLASSAAELTGASRVMCEPCPVADRRELDGKEPTTEQVRGFMNIQLAGGVTDFNNYLRLSNATPEEKKEFNEYVGRIAKHLRGGHTVADVALFYPVESLWTNFIPEPMQVTGWDSIRGGNEEAIKIEQSFRNTARMLYKNRWEYNIIDTKAIEDATIENGWFVHGNLKWKLVILPNVNTMSIAALEKLQNFVNDGGFLIAIGQTPINSTTNFPDQQIKTVSEKIFQSANAKHVKSISEIKSGNQFGQWLVPDLKVAKSDFPLRFTHRQINNEHVYFVFNDSNVALESAISLRDIKNAIIYDPKNGKSSTPEDKIVLNLNPYHGVIITAK